MNRLSNHETEVVRLGRTERDDNGSSIVGGTERPFELWSLLNAKAEQGCLLPLAVNELDRPATDEQQYGAELLIAARSSWLPPTDDDMVAAVNASAGNDTASAGDAETNGGGGGGVNVNAIAYGYILPVICLFGIVGNVANLMTLASRRLKAVSYMYLRALAIADLGCMLSVLVFCTTFTLKRRGVRLQAYWPVAFYETHIMLTLINWTVSSGVLIVVALTLDRFISVVFPIYFRQYNSSRHAAQAIVISVTISTLSYLPYAIYRHVIVEKNATAPHYEVTYKAEDSPVIKELVWHIYETVREVVLRGLPIVLLCVLNIGIIVAFRKRQQLREKMRGKLNPVKNTPSNSQMSGGSQQAQQRDDALLYLLCGIVVMFFFCNIPAAINLRVITESLKKEPSYTVFRACANLLEIFNHATNFYVFCLCSSDYRTTLLEKFPWLRAVWRGGRRLMRFVRRTPSSSSADDECQTTPLRRAETNSSAELTALRGGGNHVVRQASGDDGGGKQTSVVVHRGSADTTGNYRACQTVLQIADRDDGQAKTVVGVLAPRLVPPLALIDEDLDDFEPLMSSL